MKILKALCLVIGLASAKKGDRVFADDPSFISAQEPDWYQQGWAGTDKPQQWLDNTKGAMQYFRRAFATEHTVESAFPGITTSGIEGNAWWFFVVQMKPTIRKIGKLNFRCEKQTGKPIYKQRAADQGNEITSVEENITNERYNNNEDGFYAGKFYFEF